MANLFTRNLLNTLRLLKLARSIKKKFVHIQNPFMPCTPHLLIAINRSLRWCLEKGLAENSDYLEFGIFRGFGFWYAQALAADMGVKDMRFFGFDSFLGLPPLSEIDMGVEFHEGAYCCPRRDVEAFLIQHGVDWNKTFLVEGEFRKTLIPETIKKYKLRRCSICVIDCDLYESSKLALKFITSLIQDGTIVLFDDWRSFGNDPNKGEQKAFAEFLERNSNIEAKPFMEFGGHGKGFVLNFR